MYVFNGIRTVEICYFTHLNPVMKRKFVLPLLLLLQVILLQVLAFFPEVAERFYSRGLYPYIGGASRSVFGGIPFSVGDLAYCVLIFFLLRWFWKIRKTAKKQWKDHLLTILSIISVFYFLFNLLWGINYYRERLSDKLAIGTDYTDADLLIFTQRLIEKTNALQYEITGDTAKAVVFPYSQKEVFSKNLKGYAELSKVYAEFQYSRPSVKKSLISLPLTYMGFAGYLNPFTNEAQVNYMLPMYTFPTTSCHEMAHQLGYASESEANFVGYLASIKNKDLYFQYSGYAVALRYCLGNWEVRDEKVLDQLLATINPGIRKNFKESSLFWLQYKSFIDSGFEWFYDHFLKLNQQEEGIDSYSRFVDLLVNYYRNKNL